MKKLFILILHDSQGVFASTFSSFDKLCEYSNNTFIAKHNELMDKYETATKDTKYLYYKIGSLEEYLKDKGIDLTNFTSSFQGNMFEGVDSIVKEVCIIPSIVDYDYNLMKKYA